MSFQEALALVVTADTKGAVQGLDRLGAASDKAISKSEKDLDRWGHTLTKTGTAMIGLGGAALAGLGALAKESEQANFAQLQLENTLKNSPRLAGESEKQFLDLANSLQKVTAADADQIVAAEAMLGTFQLTADEIRKITPLTVDYARKFGVDLVDAATQVGKALDGQSGALKRNGVSIDETLFATDRYAAVQKALSEQVGGFSEAEGKTFAGSLARMRNELGDLAEGVGGGAVDAFTTLFSVVEKAANALEGISPGAQNFIGQAATFGAVGLVAAGGLNLIAGQAILARQNIGTLADAVKGLSFANLVTGLTVLAPLTLGAGIALAGYTRTKTEAKRVTDGYVEALSKETGSTRAATDAYSAAELAAGDFGSALRASNADIDLLNRAIREQGDVLDELGGQRDLIRNQGFDKAMRLAGVETSALTDELSRLSGEMSAGEFDRFIARLDSLSDGYDSATEKTKNQTFAEGELAGGTDALGASFDSTTQEVESFKDVLQGLFDPLFGVVDGQQRLADANAEVTAKEMELAAAVRDHGEGSLEAAAASDELRRAQIAATEAAVGQAGSLDTLRRGLQDGSIQIAEARRRLDEFVMSGLISTSTAAAFRAELDRLDGKSVNVSVITRYTSVGNAVLPGTTNIPLRASGGDVLAGHAYIVGEKHAELFVPDQNGTIVPSLPSTVPGGAFGGGGTTVNVYVSHPFGTAGEIGARIAESLRAYERTNGRGWRN